MFSPSSRRLFLTQNIHNSQINSFNIKELHNFNYTKLTMKKNNKLFLLTLLTAIAIHPLKAQQNPSEVRNKYFVGYSFGIPYEKETRDLSKNSNTIQVGKNFSLNNLLAIGPIVSYNHLTKGRESSIKNNSLNLGVNVALYPKYLADLIMGNDYDAYNDKLFITLDLQKTLNNSEFIFVHNINVNITELRIWNNLHLAPNIGFQYFIGEKDSNRSLGFYTIGTKFLF